MEEKIDMFYNEVKKLVPYDEERDKDYQTRLSFALSSYCALYKNYSNDEPQTVKEICTNIEKIVAEAMKGLPSSAFEELEKLLDLNPQSTNCKLETVVCSVDLKHNFYRIRQVDSIFEMKREDMFHIPLNKRGLIKTQRYSTPGYPCLYLGESIYGCWEEMHRPPMANCAVSLFQNTGELKFIDLRFPSHDDWKNPIYQKLLPLIIACTITVGHPSDSFKPEYILPQLIVEWVIKQRTKQQTLHGVVYTSSRYTNKFHFPDKTFTNYAIPVFTVEENAPYCPELCNLFKVSEPTTNEIEKLVSGGYSFDGGVFDEISEEEKAIKQYNSSDFGYLEDRLQEKSKAQDEMQQVTQLPPAVYK